MEIQTIMRGLWIVDVRNSPQFTYKNTNVKWTWVKSVEEAKYCIQHMESINHPYDIISTDHDAGTYAIYGGDYIRLLDWLEETERNYPIRIHSMNPVGVANMRAIIKRNGWTEVPFL